MKNWLTFDNRYQWFSFMLFVGIALVPMLNASFRINQAARQALFVRSGQDQYLSLARQSLADLPPSMMCRAAWLQGHILDVEGEPERRNRVLESLFSCSGVYINLLWKMNPEDQSWAEKAVETHPETADSWFWLASFFVEHNQDRAIDLYEQGLALRSNDDRKWIELGRLLAPVDPEKAMRAYLNGCTNGDFGSHGCWNAGRLAESLEMREDAIRYYRLSDWPTALQRADELESLLEKSK